MRKLIVGALMSLDGVQEAPRSWASPYFDDAAAEQALKRLLGADAMLMGRKTYEYFAPAWPQATGAYADRVNAIQKYVLSRTLTAAGWNNTTIVADDAVRWARELKEQGGGDLVVYGFGQLAHTLLENDLVDVLDLWIHPVALGGERFRNGKARALRLSGTEQRPTGVVSLVYGR
jgi:dihydrofolate reductase